MTKGIHYNKNSKRWYARLMSEGVLYSKACSSEEEAIKERVKLERRYNVPTTNISPLSLQKQIQELKETVDCLQRSQAALIKRITEEQEWEE